MSTSVYYLQQLPTHKLVDRDSQLDDWADGPAPPAVQEAPAFARGETRRDPRVIFISPEDTFGMTSEELGCESCSDDDEWEDLDLRSYWLNVETGEKTYVSMFASTVEIFAARPSTVQR